ncbi:putative phage protein gp47/JayE [Pedobacter sp. AK013]|uniref:baseplate J/gp47 family protein n=1 Tax=Pedobacter sp. AK013 TaxID=2723071 RepID=UPI00160A53E1|nr:baseplate J/gp47 family protein [Pedobacter sp. AK013]MBB6236488.1 putative phage protein gp47/JayE [Pedobacter sp. AK013]
MKPIPSLIEIKNRIELDFKSKLDLADTDLRKVFDALDSVLAAELKLIYLYLQDVLNNVFPDTADTAANGGELNRIGQIYLNRQPRTPTDGKYNVTVNGSIGAVLRSGLIFKSNDSSNAPGNLYVLDTEFVIGQVPDTIVLRSVNAGKEYLLNVGDGLSVTEPVIGLDQSVVVSEIVQQPTQAEDTDLYRQNILDAIRLEPQGGAKTDYRIWASDAPGVRKVYPYVKNGDAGTVQVYVEATPVDSEDGHGTPSGAILASVAEVIEFDPDETLPLNERGRRPIQAVIEVLPIDAIPIDVNITGLQVDTSTIRSAISENLAAYLADIRPYISGADLPRDRNDNLTTVKLQSVVNDTIGNANTFLNFNMLVDGALANIYQFSAGTIPYLRTVTYL